MRKRELIWITIAVVALIISIAPAATKKDSLYPQYEMFTSIVNKVLNEYVDPVDPEKLFQGAYGGMVSSLDPYSQFLPVEQKQELDIDTSGQYGGLGIEINLDRAGFLTVVTPMEDTPAFRSGVLAGDKIIKVGDKNVLAIPQPRRLSDAVKLLRGKPGTPVTISVVHENNVREDITMTREIISTKSLQGARMVDEDMKIGYVRLSQFQEGTVKELDSAVKRLEGQGMKALILDLRLNPGGLLSEAVAVSDRFISEGMIVSTRGRTPNSNQEFKATKGDDYPNIPVAVLISHRSASASEIVSGALQDHKRAVIVGTRSFGKGSVQTITELPDGSGLRLTTARYYTPNGRSIHRNPYDENVDEEKGEWGIIPDFKVPVTRDEELAMIDKWRDEHIIKKQEEKSKEGAAAPTTKEEKTRDTTAAPTTKEEEPKDMTAAPETKDKAATPTVKKSTETTPMEEELGVPPTTEEKAAPKKKEFIDRQLDTAKTVLKAVLLTKEADPIVAPKAAEQKPAVVEAAPAAAK